VGTQTRGYYFGSSNEAVATDYDGASTYSHYQDGLDRQTEEIDPIGWKLATYPSPTESDMFAAVGDTTPSIGCNSCQHTQTILDGWGRTSSQILVNNPIGPVNVDTLYDGAGRVGSVSHPYAGASDPNHVYETYAYDGLDRTVSVTHPDGQVTRTAYGPSVVNLGGVTTQTGSASTYGYGYPQIALDESGKQRQEWLDGFGNIIEVDEPSTSTATQGTGSITLYQGSSQYACDDDGGNCQTWYDNGTVSVTVLGKTFTTYYGQNDSGAAGLTAQLNASGLVSAVLTNEGSADYIALTAIAPGVNAPISGSCISTWSQSAFSQDLFSCGGPDYSGIS